LLLLAAGAALGGFALGGAARAADSAVAEKAEAKHAFSIRRGPLAEALRAFSQQSSLPVMTIADLNGKTARGVSGLLAPEKALAQLIGGQGLVIQRIGGGYVLKPAPAPSRPGSRPGPAGATEVDAVVVASYRASLLGAQVLQRQAVTAQSVILADDIAAFPDLNLAESLQRIPGVAITRDAGEGRQITLRGLGPDFTRTQLNGMEVLANTASGMDNRGSVSRTRAFDFSMFASELFDKVTVQKSYSVDQDEGGIAGTVQLETAKPFDFTGFKAVLSAKGQNNSNTSGSTTPHVVGLVSNRWGDFGVLASIAYSENDSNEYGYRNWGWSQAHFNPANIGPGVPANVAAQLEANGPNEIYAPQAETYSTWYTRRRRVGATLALQYDARPDLRMGLDLLYGRLTNQRDDYALAAAGTNGLTGDVTGTQVLNSAVIRGNTLIAAGYSGGVDLRSEYNQMNDSTDFYQAVWKADWRPAGPLSVKAMVGYSQSDYALPVFDKVFLEAPNHAFAYDDRPASPTNAYGFNVADPSQWNLMRLDTQENAINSAYANAKLDVAYALDAGSTLKFGAEYKDFTNSGWQRDDKVFYNTPTDTPIPAGDKLLVPDLSVAPYVVGDVGGTYSYIGQTRNLNAGFTMPGTDYAVEERTAAAYLQYDLDTDLWGRRSRIDAGVRYYATDLTSSGTLENGVSAAPISISHPYHGLLPALNVAVDVAHDLVARFSVNRNISRPALSDLAAAGSLTTAPFGGSVSAGNPNLTPFLATSVDFSLEYYLGRVGYVSVGLFYKNMASFITTQTTVVPYAATGLPLSFLLPGQNGSILYNYSRPINGPGADIKGVEIAFQRDFDFLPGVLRHLGLVANVTYADGSSPVLFGETAVTLPLENLSRYSANATLYYETSRWGARVSEAYRSRYLDGTGGDGNIGEFVGATSNVDAQAHYNLSPRLKLIVEGINLTDQPIIQYTDVAAQRIEVNTRSGRTFTFGFSYEF
jgi:iron complex outermembrane receptor protein